MTYTYLRTGNGQKEAEAWNDHARFTSPWTASVEESSTSVKAEVRAWERSKR